VSVSEEDGIWFRSLEIEEVEDVLPVEREIDPGAVSLNWPARVVDRTSVVEVIAWTVVIEEEAIIFASLKVEKVIEVELDDVNEGLSLDWPAKVVDGISVMEVMPAAVVSEKETIRLWTLEVDWLIAASVVTELKDFSLNRLDVLVEGDFVVKVMPSTTVWDAEDVGTISFALVVEESSLLDELAMLSATTVESSPEATGIPAPTPEVFMTVSCGIDVSELWTVETLHNDVG
jgi:hypothetical protein